MDRWMTSFGLISWMDDDHRMKKCSNPFTFKNGHFAKSRQHAKPVCIPLHCNLKRNLHQPGILHAKESGLSSSSVVHIMRTCSQSEWGNLSHCPTHTCFPSPSQQQEWVQSCVTGKIKVLLFYPVLAEVVWAHLTQGQVQFPARPEEVL